MEAVAHLGKLVSHLPQFLLKSQECVPFFLQFVSHVQFECVKKQLSHKELTECVVVVNELKLHFMGKVEQL